MNPGRPSLIDPFPHLESDTPVSFMSLVVVLGELTELYTCRLQDCAVTQSAGSGGDIYRPAWSLCAGLLRSWVCFL